MWKLTPNVIGKHVDGENYVRHKEGKSIMSKAILQQRLKGIGHQTKKGNVKKMAKDIVYAGQFRENVNLCKQLCKQ